MLHQLETAACSYIQSASRSAAVLLVEGSYIDAVIHEPVPCDATTEQPCCGNQTMIQPCRPLREL
jgi:hypothetical protein